MHIDSKQQIAGFSMLEIRALFRPFVLSGLTIEYARHFLGTTRARTRELLAGLAEQGYLTETAGARNANKAIWHYTDLGRRLCQASAAQQVTRKTATSRLVTALERAIIVNDDADYLARVDELAVFGSFLSDQERLSDVDIAIQFSLKNGLHRDTNLFGAHARAHGVHRLNKFESIIWPEIHVQLYLKNRSRVLSFHGFDEIETLGVHSVAYITGGELTEAGRQLISGASATGHSPCRQGAAKGRLDKSSTRKAPRNR